MPVMSWPSMEILPEVGCSKPASMRNRVVLPQPEPPSSANSSPRMMSSETSLTAVNPPNVLVTCPMRTNGSPCCGGVMLAVPAGLQNRKTITRI